MFTVDDFMFTEVDFDRVLKIEPLLTQFGITNKKDIEIPLDRFYLRNDIIDKVQNIMVYIPRSKGFLSPTSYHLKHVLENIIGEYVSNGEMIAACIYLGFEYKYMYSHGCQGTLLPNVIFNFGQTGYKMLRKQMRVH